MGSDPWRPNWVLFRGSQQVNGRLYWKILGVQWNEFRERDTSLSCMRVQLDVRQPLRRKKKVSFNLGNISYVTFKYERLMLFSFFCGRLGHSDSFCQIKMDLGFEVGSMTWDLSLRAQTRRALAMHNIWLREDRNLESSHNNLDSEVNLRSRGKSFKTSDRIDPILGMDLVGNLHLKKEQMDMEHDLDVCILNGEDGKKRPRRERDEPSDGDEGSSIVERNMRLLESNLFLSVATKGLADRSQ